MLTLALVYSLANRFGFRSSTLRCLMTTLEKKKQNFSIMARASWTLFERIILAMRDKLGRTMWGASLFLSACSFLVILAASLVISLYASSRAGGMSTERSQLVSNCLTLLEKAGSFVIQEGMGAVEWSLETLEKVNLTSAWSLRPSDQILTGSLSCT